MHRMMAAGVAIAVLAVPGPRGVDAQVGSGLTTMLVSRADSTQRYAAFVPSTVQPGVPRPLVLVMDYRGRALLPLERMAPVAERLGYIVLSSYDTRSDETPDINERAIAAMIEDAQDLFTIDPRRLYFVGMSGTARAAWAFAESFRPYTAGVIGFGAALPSPAELIALSADGPIRFAYYGGAGHTDYNYEEMRSFDWRLDEYDMHHFVEFYPGPHLWPEADVFERALEWLDIQAVLAGTQGRSTDVIEAAFDRRLRRASELEAEGDLEAAWQAYRSLTRDFATLLDTRRTRESMDRLEGYPALAEARRGLRREVDDRFAYDERLAAWIQRVEQSKRVADIDAGRNELDIRRLLSQAGDDGDPHAADAAQRKLEDVFVHASFYQPRKYVPAGRYDLARAFYHIAHTIKPEDPQVCLSLAQASSQTGRIDEALEAFECAVASGAFTAGELDADTLLEPIRSESRYAELRARLTG